MKRRLDASKVTESALRHFKEAIDKLEVANDIIVTEIEEHEEQVLKAKEDIKNLEHKISYYKEEIGRKEGLININGNRIESLKKIVGGIC